MQLAPGLHSDSLKPGTVASWELPPLSQQQSSQSNCTDCHKIILLFILYKLLAHVQGYLALKVKAVIWAQGWM